MVTCKTIYKNNNTIVGDGDDSIGVVSEPTPIVIRTTNYKKNFHMINKV